MENKMEASIIKSTQNNFGPYMENAMKAINLHINNNQLLNSAEKAFSKELRRVRCCNAASRSDALARVLGGSQCNSRNDAG